MKKSTLSLTLLVAAALFFTVSQTLVGTTDSNSSSALSDYTHGTWEINFEQALARAKAENKPMLLDFTGSDWCGWCIRLDKEVFKKIMDDLHIDKNDIINADALECDFEYYPYGEDRSATY